MSGEINNQTPRLGGLNLGVEPPETLRKPVETTEHSTGLVGLGKAPVDNRTLTLEHRLRRVVDSRQPLTKEQIRGRLENGLSHAVGLGVEQATAIESTLEIQAMSQAKQIALELGKLIAGGLPRDFRREGYQLRGLRVCAPNELTEVLGAQLAGRAIDQRVKNLLQPVLSEQGLSITIQGGEVTLQSTSPTKPSGANQEVREALTAGLERQRNRRAEISKLGEQIGASFLTQLTLKAKVAQSSGVGLFPVDASSLRQTERTTAKVPVNFDIETFGKGAAQLLAGMSGPEVTQLWGVVTATLGTGIEGTHLEKLPLPLLGADASGLTFGRPKLPALGSDAARAPR